MREGRWTAAAERPPATDYERGLRQGWVDALEHVLASLNTPGVDATAMVHAMLKGAQTRAAERGID